MIYIKRQKDGHQKVPQKKGNNSTIFNLDTFLKTYMKLGAQKIIPIHIVFLICKNEIEKNLLQTFE